ncbi:MAG: hypothetical protein H7645_02895 [Candidatus Heimdallarchaeota archaeon]|nr:hypothetical protein [Candidatus Heimdallarchaeota archaeon]MCK4769263.1 hypothetical protein [Candidatus Heimdallarchaeota archaeon]
MIASILPLNIQTINSSSDEEPLKPPQLELDKVNTNLTLFIEFIGFEEEFIDESEILGQITHTYDRGSSLIGTSKIKFDFSISYATDAETLVLKRFIEDICVSGTGVGKSINKTRLSEDLATGVRSDIFNSEDGMVVDVEDVEDFISSNYYDKTNAREGYTMFLLNFSCFDTPDHNQEHWYHISKESYDTNRTINHWYSGYNNIPEKPTLGWGGDERFCFIDLSSRTWYFDWITTAWPSLVPSSAIYYDSPDVDSLIQEYDPYTPAGKSKLSEYIAAWIQSYMGNLFSAYYGASPIGRSYSIQVLFFENLTINGYSFEDLNWVLSENRMLSQLNEDFPWIEWKIEVEYVRLIDYPEVYDYMADNVQLDQDGLYIEVMDGFFTYLSNRLFADFNYSAADTVLPCYGFLTNNVGLKYYGVRFAGLGGMGWEIITGAPGSIFEDGAISKPRRGFTQVMIHELGHSLGFPHPHSYTYGWGSSFVKETMNYFSLGEESFSTFYRDGLARSHGNYFYLLAKEEMDLAYTIFIDAGAPSELDWLVEEVYSMLNGYLDLYNELKYLAAVLNMTSVLDKIELIPFYIAHPEEIPTEPTEKTTFPIVTISFAVVWILMKKRKRFRK